MSKSTVTVTGISEGSKLEKKDINDTVDSWLEASENVSGENIREEGLDRRVFKSDATWAQGKGSKSETSNGAFRHISLAEKDANKWVPVRQEGKYPDNDILSLFNNGVGIPEVCAVQWDWDPDLDTYCVIRASFFFYFDVGNFGHRGRDAKGSTVGSDWRTEQFFKFGIAVKRFDDETGIASFVNGTHGYAGVRRLDNADGDIFACQQIGLNNGWSKYTASRNTIRFDHDRRTAMSSSFTLVASGTSGENNHTFNLESNMCAIDMRKKGTYAAVLVVKPKKVQPEVWVGAEIENQAAVIEPLYFKDNSTPECGFFNMNVQTFRR